MLSALALAAALVWCSRPERGRATSAPPPRAVAKGAESSARGPAAAFELAPAPAPALAELPEPPRREAPVPAGLAVAGRIEVAGGLPPGHEPVVVARAYRADVSRLHSRRIETRAARDGSFALSVPEDTRSVGLEIEAPLLYLTEEVEVAPGTLDVVLRPRLLALLRGRVHAPLGIVVPPDAGLLYHVSAGGQSAGYTHSDGSFELVVEPERPLLVTARGEADLGELGPNRTEVSLEIAALAPGEERWLDLFPDVLLRVRGVVTDESGVPLEGATVALSVALERPGERPAERPESEQTDVSGRFALGPFAAGVLELVARAPGHQSARRTFDHPAETRNGVQLVLGQPPVVRGRVLAPDGTPYEGALVRDMQARWPFHFIVGGDAGSEAELLTILDARLEGRGSARGASEGVRTDHEGRFTLVSEEESVRIVAWAPGFAEATPLALALGPGEEREGVVLTLRHACALSLRVVDEGNQPVDTTLLLRFEDGSTRLFETDGGAFEARELPPGRVWIGSEWIARTSGKDDFMRVTGSVEVELTPEAPAHALLRLARAD